jgi:hypothetical protein
MHRAAHVLYDGCGFEAPSSINGEARMEVLHELSQSYGHSRAKTVCSDVAQRRECGGLIPSPPVPGSFWRVFFVMPPFETLSSELMFIQTKIERKHKNYAQH